MKKKRKLPYIIIMIVLVVAAIPVGAHNSLSHMRDEAYGYMYSIMSDMYDKTYLSSELVDENKVSGEARSAIKIAYTKLNNALYEDDIQDIIKYNKELDAAAALADSADPNIAEYLASMRECDDELVIDIQQYNDDAEEFNTMLESHILSKVSFVKPLELYTTE